jgi:hypothetical protein
MIGWSPKQLLGARFVGHWATPGPQGATPDRAAHRGVDKRKGRPVRLPDYPLGNRFLT